MAKVEMPPIFIADDIGLDFLNSVSTPVDTRVEWIEDGEGLIDWLRTADLVPVKVLDSFESASGPGELDAVANQARALREWFRGFVQKNKGKPLGKSVVGDLAPINRILARDEAFKELVERRDPDSGKVVAGVDLETTRRWRSPESLLIPIAESFAELVASEDFTDVKACQGQSCTLLFVDRTRRRTRRWCSMAVCGNRAKQAAHRERQTKVG
ncbi:CGNR zinc finger domain-containing protein [Dyella humicola]|uniref:CGNR zinc finger domain-containing protein n=1 Tax=Dyella humicola TaxID=2992126 RepID=UPI00225B690C|nr:ABATE domain-containing protein [Dyella humicola]